MTRASTDILILGAGLQGAGIALELARRGVSSTLVDQDHRALNRASLRNEGKIHLGLIWANDRSLATGLLLQTGALRFRGIVDGWLGGRQDWLGVSTPFVYLVARDSVLDADTLAAHYAALETHCRRALEERPELDYLGTRPSCLARRMSDRELAPHFDLRAIAAGFATAELSIDINGFAAQLRAAIDESPHITFRASHVVRSVAEDADGFRVEGDGPDGPWSVAARQVVNATWERRLVFDRQLGIAPPADVLHRLKFRVLARLPPGLHGAPSVSMVLGRYGDVVIWRDGTACLSWYPAGLQGWTNDIEPPADWDAACRGEVRPEVARDLSARMMAGIAAWYPGIAACEPDRVDGGAIVAIGRTDVDDAASALHKRSGIGVSSRRGYHSVDSGKLTTAPLFAIDAADRIEAYGRGEIVG